MKTNFKNSLNKQLKTPESETDCKPIKKSNIEKLFENFDGEYTPTDADFGEPIGEEIL